MIAACIAIPKWSTKVILIWVLMALWQFIQNINTDVVNKCRLRHCHYCCKVLKFDSVISGAVGCWPLSTMVGFESWYAAARYVPAQDSWRQKDNLSDWSDHICSTVFIDRTAFDSRGKETKIIMSGVTWFRLAPAGIKLCRIPTSLGNYVACNFSLWLAAAFTISTMLQLDPIDSIIFFSIRSICRPRNNTHWERGEKS